jgi:hypothetical protein
LCYSKRMTRLNILLLLLVVVILGAGVFTYFFVHRSGAASLGPQVPIGPNIIATDTPVTSEVFSSTQTNVQNSAMPSSLVLIYSTIASSTMTQNRLWQNLNIWKKVGNAAPELVGQSGAVGEYAAAEVVSPTHNYLAINLEQSVDIIDLQTKQKRRVLNGAQWVIGVGFSLDGSKLFITDGASYVNNAVKKFHTIDLATGADTVVTPDQSIPEIEPVLWRKDGLLLYYPVSYKDCGSHMESFSFVTGKSALSFEEYGLSADGMAALGSSVESVPSPYLNEMCGPDKLPTIVKVVEPVTGKVLGRVGKSGEPLTFVSFSPDNTQVLFKTSTDQKKYTYYLQDVSATSTPVAVSDPNTLLATWKANTGPVSYLNQYEVSHSLFVDGKPIVTSDQSPILIAQYFQ